MAWVDGSNLALFTDLYELTMLRSYFEQGLRESAVFDLYVRTLPRERNYLLACGLDDALSYLEELAFTPEAIDHLGSLDQFPPPFLEQLRALRFTGDVYAVAEGTPVFANEPLLEVVAPLPEAQLAETFLLNQLHHQTLIASKGARVVEAAAGRAVTDFGTRRAHGTDAAMKGARALYVAGVAATSNVLAGQRYGIPVAGTMAHSFVQAHEDESAAFRAFTASFSHTVLLVDTYDTMDGVRAVIRLVEELGDPAAVSAVRLDSGDLGAHARAARRLLDEAGLDHVEIFASGGLDERSIADLIGAGAPIDGFGVGSRLDVAEDAPYMDAVYKLVAYAGRNRIKLSSEKATLPGRKQVFRTVEGGEMVRDVIAARDEAADGEPLLVQVMSGGRRLPAGETTLEQARTHAHAQRERLPARLRALEPAQPPYPVEVSARLRDEQDRLRRAAGSRAP